MSPIALPTAYEHAPQRVVLCADHPVPYPSLTPCALGHGDRPCPAPEKHPHTPLSVKPHTFCRRPFTGGF